MCLLMCSLKTVDNSVYELLVEARVDAALHRIAVHSTVQAGNDEYFWLFHIDYSQFGQWLSNDCGNEVNRLRSMPPRGTKS